jgi:hypothetical protein
MQPERIAAFSEPSNTSRNLAHNPPTLTPRADKAALACAPLQHRGRFCDLRNHVLNMVGHDQSHDPTDDFDILRKSESAPKFESASIHDFQGLETGLEF